MSEDANRHALQNQSKWIKLSPSEVKHIFIYYIISFFLSLAACIGLISRQSPASLSMTNLASLIFSSFCFGLLGSTFYYIRKLYKSCIQLLVDTMDNDVSLISLGAKIYFYMRPIMGATLAIIIILGIYGGFFFLQDQPSINGEKFYIFSAIFSFIVGFSNGKIIVKLDHSTDKVADLFKLTKDE